MVERIKNKRGFTIIEIMVVIALIGILASVLVPQFGGVRDRARDTGVLTNVKMVEAYVASVIDNYPVSDAGFDDLVADITAYFSETGANALTNPYTSTNANTISVPADGGTSFAASGEAGQVCVIIDPDTLHTYINGFDAEKNELKGTQRTVTR